MASNRKIDEALSHIREAEKNLKTGLLKWKPDYDSAADDYNAAAKCYRVAKQYSQCRECFIKASENYKICGTHFASAKCIEQAALVSKDMGELDKVASHAEHAGVMYRDVGSLDSAAQILEKAGKIIEGDYIDKALHLYKFACEVAENDDRPRQASELQSRICRHLVRLKRFDEAVNAIRKEMGLHQAAESGAAVGRLCLVLIMVQIARGDVVAAEKAYREWGAYCDNDIGRVADSLIRAYDEEDGALARRALDNPLVKHMDVEYSILARDMKTPKIREPKATGKSSTFMPDPEDAQESEEELDLC